MANQSNIQERMLQFNFNKTIHMLKRGEDDPINIIQNGHWRRCFYHENTINLLSTSYSEQNLAIAILDGSIAASDARQLIEYTLGFDDPFLGSQINRLPHADKLQSAIGLNIPGYPDLFEALIQVIMGQQVSVLVANKVRAKFTRAFGEKITHAGHDYYAFPRPQVVVKLAHAQIRELGLSNNKCKAILGAAQAFLENDAIHELHLNSDPVHIRQVLTALYGVGNWTVDWLLMRHFRRFDIIPETDLAVQKAFTWWLDHTELMTPDEVKQFEEKFYPFGGSVAFRVLYAYSSGLKRQSDG